MMRHSLNPAIGMDQADHHRQYTTTTGYEMNEERQLLGDDSGKTKRELKKAIKHSRTKAQKKMLSHQLITRAKKYQHQMREELDADEIPTIRDTKNAGRRRQDKINLSKRIVFEDEKAKRLTRTKLTVEAIQAEAARTKPTNDETFVFEPVIITWRENVTKMSTQAF